MKDKIAILTPTRRRLDELKGLIASWERTTEGFSDFIFGMDNDDHTYDSLIEENPNFIFEMNPQMRPLTYLNFLALKYCDEYNYLCFMEDDFRFNSEGWESIFIQQLKKDKVGIVWGEDGIHNGKLVDSPVITSNIVKKLGYMVPPVIECLFSDYFFRRIGLEVGILHYFPDVKITHRHYYNKKRERDGISEEMDKFDPIDKPAWKKYLKSSSFKKDCSKLRNLCRELRT